MLRTNEISTNTDSCVAGYSLSVDAIAGTERGLSRLRAPGADAPAPLQRTSGCQSGAPQRCGRTASIPRALRTASVSGSGRSGRGRARCTAGSARRETRPVLGGLAPPTRGPCTEEGRRS